jgi:putative membrane protein
MQVLVSVGLLVVWTGAVRADEKLVDDDFLPKASSCTHTIISVSKLADKHASSPKVKAFAAEMVKEHEACLDKIAELMKNRKIGVVTGLEKDAKAEIDRLSKLQGSEFDKAYLTWIIEKHKDGIKMLETQIKDGKNADTTAMAKEALPKLRQHLKHAEQLAKDLGA